MNKKVPINFINRGALFLLTLIRRSSLHRFPLLIFYSHLIDIQMISAYHNCTVCLIIGQCLHAELQEYLMGLENKHLLTYSSLFYIPKKTSEGSTNAKRSRFIYSVYCKWILNIFDSIHTFGYLCFVKPLNGGIISALILSPLIIGSEILDKYSKANNDSCTNLICFLVQYW